MKLAERNRGLLSDTRPLPGLCSPLTGEIVTTTRRISKSSPSGNSRSAGKPRAADIPRKGAKAPAAPPPSGSRRKAYVLLALVGTMLATSALLLAIQPGPLLPDASRRLMATEGGTELTGVFETRVPIEHNRWKYVYIHHSRTPAGNAAELGGANGLSDHFVIGNGQGCADGEIQVGQRWNQQQPAGRTAGTNWMDPTCISICLVGDFDNKLPTPVQMQRLSQLVQKLQERLKIGQDRVHVLDAPNSPAGAGRYFPRDAFFQQLLP